MTASGGRGTATQQSDGTMARAPVRRYGIFILAAIAMAVIALLTTTNDLSLWPALAGCAVIAGAAFLLRGSRPVGEAIVAAIQPGDQSADILIAELIAGLPDPAIILDGQGRVVALNASAVDMAPALRRGEHASIALRMPEVVEAIRTVTLGGGPQRIEFSERVPNDRWLEAIVTPIAVTRSQSRQALVVMTVHDLTPLRRVEEMRADFVANASHELRTPLAALSGFIETLQGSARDDGVARERFLIIMQAQARRMARLIDDLLSLSRIELSAHVRPDTPVDLVPLMRQVVDGLQTLARDRGVSVDVQAPAAPLIVPGDRDELIRVFENLVENGLKYGASGGRVDITLLPAARLDGTPEARIAVRDYGPGISAEHLPRLTERFYRVDVVESRAQGGTGLGLSLVKHILSRHRGRLTVESSDGKGATFTAYVPLSPAGVPREANS